jgi:predicted hydrocarbon binding protein/capsular polysaccharide biosynthesis protein
VITDRRTSLAEFVALARDLSAGLAAFHVSPEGATTLAVSPSGEESDALERRLILIAADCHDRADPDEDVIVWESDVPPQTSGGSSTPLRAVAVPVHAGEDSFGVIGIADHWLPEPVADLRRMLRDVAVELGEWFAVSAATAPPEIMRTGFEESAQPAEVPAGNALGRLLAAQLFNVLKPVPPVDAVDPVEDMLRAAERSLMRHGLHLRVLRIKPASAVVRATPQGPYSEESCAALRGFLAAVPELVYGREGSVTETTCVGHGAEACMFAIQWETSPAESWEWMDAAVLEDDVAYAAPEVEPPAFVAPELLPPPALPEHETEPVPPQADSVALPHLPPEEASHETGASKPQAQLRTHRRRAPWLARRAYLLVLLTVAGIAGGYAAGARSQSHYVASALLEVRSGASSAGPGGANDAGALAITYAALIPDDSSVLHAAASKLGASVSAVAASLTANVESGTSLLSVRYSAPTASAALAGVDTVAKALTGSHGQAAIGPGSIALVSLPATATLSKGLHSLGLPLGALAGIALGALAVVVAERVDKRIDRAGDLSEAAGCAASELGNGFSTAELARAVSLAGAQREGALTVVALSEGAVPAAERLVSELRSSWLRNELEPRRIEVLRGFGNSAGVLAEGRGPTVLAACHGERIGRAGETSRRLEAIGRKPVWAVLVAGKKRRVGHNSG